jgi:hypothetical protein
MDWEGMKWIYRMKAFATNILGIDLISTINPEELNSKKKCDVCLKQDSQDKLNTQDYKKDGKTRLSLDPAYPSLEDIYSILKPRRINHRQLIQINRALILFGCPGFHNIELIDQIGRI